MAELNNAILNIHNTMQIQAQRGNSDAEFVMKHLPDVRKLKRGDI